LDGNCVGLNLGCKQPKKTIVNAKNLRLAFYNSVKGVLWLKLSKGILYRFMLHSVQQNNE